MDNNITLVGFTVSMTGLRPKTKVTIRPKFFGTVTNFEGLSRKNMRSFRMLNCPKFRTVSRICPDLTSRCVEREAVDQNAVDHFDVFACQRCVLLSSKCTKSIFGRPDPAGGAYNAPLPIPLSSLGVSKSVPNFYNRFMVTLPKTKIYLGQWGTIHSGIWPTSQYKSFAKWHHQQTMATSWGSNLEKNIYRYLLETNAQ